MKNIFLFLSLLLVCSLLFLAHRSNIAEPQLSPFPKKTVDQSTIELADKRAKELLNQMTLDEKIDYIGGYNYFYIRAIPRLGIPELKMADGPLGVRNYVPSISYPAAITVAASWDTSLAHRMGVALGQDSKARGVHFLLGPGMNIYRSPLCGRNFEYFGEDPFLTSKIVVSLITGTQSQGVIATAKHFVANNQEWNRHQVSSDIDERTLREIYLPAFEASVKEADVGAIMNSYNLLNGIHTTQHSYLNNDIAKKEWGFRGVIMSDWNATYDGIQAVNGGLDLEMPYAKCMSRQTILQAIQEGKISETTIDDKVLRILRTAIEFGFFNLPQTDLTCSLFNQEGKQVALEIAQSGMVLLKNNGLLPIDKTKLKSIAVIGPRAQQQIPQGGGSSDATPILFDSLLGGISNALDPKIKILYSPGVPQLAEIVNWYSFTPSINSTETGLLGEYFDNSDLQGHPAMTRVDHSIRFQWKERSYRDGGPVNNYSARWTGFFTPLTDGETTLYVSGNDGFRLYVDDTLLIDNWHNTGESLQWKNLMLEAKKSYKIRLEYYVEKGAQGIEFGVAAGIDRSIADATEKAAQANVVILCVGFDSSHEGEDWDRSFQLSEAQNLLIQAVLAVNPNVIVAMTAGGNVDMSSWIDKTPALLYIWYPGQEGGKALAQILFGEITPSGKLPVSFERNLEDNATYAYYYDSDNTKRVAYKEGIFVGYRHFDKNKIQPLFPFGYGLSYTTFQYSNLNISPIFDNGEKCIEVSCDISNMGKRAGAEIVQVYVGDNHSKVERPLKELKGFDKIFLKPGETKKIKVLLNKRAFSYYDVDAKQWSLDPGNFEILVGSSSACIELRGNIGL